METQFDSQKDTRWWDLPAVFLLLILLSIGFTRLIATQWTEGLTIIRVITYLGVASGLALGYSRFSPRTAGIFAFIYGLFTVAWRLGNTLGPDILWQVRLANLFSRLSATINQLLHQQAVSDNLLFLTLMSALFWVLSVDAGYSLTRHASPWRTVLPTGLAMVVIHSYDAFESGRVWFLVLYLFFALLLVARLVYLQNRSRWESTRTYMPPQIGGELIRVALGLTVLMLLLSWTAPAMAESIPAAQDAWQRIKEPWDNVRNSMDNAFASLRSSVGIVSDYYGTNMALGRGNRLTDSIVFTVQAPENPPSGVRYYWRARVYDVYENGQWKSSLNAIRTEDPDTFDLKYPTEPNRGPQLFSFTFTATSPVATLFTATQPVWVSQPVKAELSTNPDGTVDLGAFRATPTLRAGGTYTARSSLSDVSIAQMREAGTNYPDWIKQRYLELPPEVTPRTRQLALEIAGKQTTAYDKANVITEYLRSNIQYSAVVPPLPQNQELVDWFLFDLKKGFCNYYATAEVVLLRSLGIPARLGVGYAEGEHLANSTEYVIRQRDAHAWPEVYFPGVGWVEFEPTAGQPGLARPIGVSTINPSILEQLNQLNDLKGNTNSDQLSNTPLPGLVPGLEALAKSPKFQQTFLISVLSLSLLLALASFAWKRGLYQRITPVPILLERGFRRVGIRPPPFLHLWALHASLSPLARAYHEINRALARLGKPPRPTETPFERATLLVSELPAAATPAQRLLAEYETATYGRRAADIQAAKQAGAEIRSLSFKAFFQRLFRRRKDPEKENSW